MVVLRKVLANHLSLEMSRLSRVGTHEGNVVVVIEDDTLIALLLDGTVEEDEGNVRGCSLLANHVGALGTAAVDDVDNQDGCAIADGLVNLGVLRNLVVVRVVLLVGDAP